MLIPREQIQFRRGDGEHITAFTPLLTDCEATGATESEAVRELQREAHKKLIALRNAGQPIPEPFLRPMRRGRYLFGAVGILVVIAISLIVARLDRKVEGYPTRHIGPRMTVGDVEELAGKPNELITLKEKEGYVELKSRGVAEIWRYNATKSNEAVDVYVNAEGMVLGTKRSPPLKE